MSVMFIGEGERRAVSEAIKNARANPMRLRAGKSIAAERDTDRLMLNERRPGVEFVRAVYPPQHVMLGTYRAAFSFEEQPAGLFRHLSVSSRAKDKVPGPEAMQMACEAFGFSDKLCKAIGRSDAVIMWSELPVRIWLEEFEPGRMAVNVTELDGAPA